MDDIGGWRKLRKEELHNLNPSPNIIRFMMLKRTRCAEHVVRMGRSGMHITFGCKGQKERDN
jgi:hypothetical protein